jgi:hypothetical protein
MSRHSRLTATVISASMLFAALSVAAYAQRGGRQHPTHHPHATRARTSAGILRSVFGRILVARPIYRITIRYDNRAEPARLAPDETRQAAVYVGFFVMSRLTAFVAANLRRARRGVGLGAIARYHNFT